MSLEITALVPREHCFDSTQVKRQLRLFQTTYKDAQLWIVQLMIVFLWLVFLMDHLWVFCLVFLMLSSLFIAALWAPAGKGLTSWLLLVMFIKFCVTFPCCILGQVWYLIVSFPDLCRLSYFYYEFFAFFQVLYIVYFMRIKQQN